MRLASAVQQWIPTIAGTKPSVYADWINNRYIFNGTFYSTHSTWASAVGLTAVRASTNATNLLSSSASGFSYTTYSANTARFISTGILPENDAYNLFVSPTAPATQVITIGATGTYTLWVNGAGSCAIAAGTAVGSSFGTATNGSPVTFTITVIGTVVCTVTGSLNAAQLELGTRGSSFITNNNVRNEDRYLIGPTGGVPFTGWSAASMTVMMQATTATAVNPAGANYILFDASDGTTPNEMILIHTEDGKSHLDDRSLNVGETTNKIAAASAMGNGALIKVAGAFKTDDYGYAVGGSYVGALLGAANYPTVDRINIGGRSITGQAWCNGVSVVAIWPGLRGTQEQLTQLSD